MKVLKRALRGSLRAIGRTLATHRELKGRNRASYVRQEGTTSGTAVLVVLVRVLILCGLVNLIIFCLITFLSKVRLFAYMCFGKVQYLWGLGSCLHIQKQYFSCVTEFAR